MSTPGPSVSLYESAVKIYPRRASGRYARLRVMAMLALLGFYYAVPWINFGETPLVWFDLPHRRFYVFGLQLVPQDLFLLAGLLLIAALTLFFFTSLAGRLWCGYACPQTVWTEAFLWIEHFVEGDRYARMKLDHAPWGAQKLLRKGGKHLLWLILGLYTGLTFVAYFVPARELFPAALQFQLAGWPLFWSLFYGFATWGNAGFLREQVCKYMCPYARFQSAMFDRDTLIIAYDSKRGEPRKSLIKKAMSAASRLRLAPSSAGDSALSPLRGVRDLGALPVAVPAVAGDCIDCSLCVQVCPTGIDIRKGLQYECIACAACVDACNSVMDSVHKPHGLIRYTSASQDAGTGFRILRPRTLGYGVVWLLMIGGFLLTLGMRTPLELDVIRDRHSLYRELADDSIENVYALKLNNKDNQAHVYRLSVSTASGAPLSVLPDRVQLMAHESRTLTVSVRTAPPGDAHEDAGELHRVNAIEFAVAAEDDPRLHTRRSARFLTGDSE